MTLVHAGLCSFLISFIIGAVLQMSGGGVGGSRIASNPCTCRTLSFPHFIHHWSCDTGGVGMGVGGSRIASNPCTCRTLSFPHFIHHWSCDTGGVGMGVEASKIASNPCTCRTLSFPHFIHHWSCDTGELEVRVGVGGSRIASDPYPFLILFIIGAVIQVSWGW